MSESVEMLRDGRYAILRELGQGAQAATLEAVDKVAGRVVAIKRFSVRGARSWKDVELAEREARVLSSLSHQALPAYIEHFEEAGCLYLVMERIEGRSLSELSRNGTRFGQDDVVQFLREAGAALDYLHSRAPPVIHRDIKPGNIVRRPDGSFAIVDFGSVRDSLRPEGGSTVVGTFGYMAPEQFQGRALPASDVYAVGATALSLLTGLEPDKLPHRGLAIDVPAALAGVEDPALVRVLSAMVEIDPERRASRITPLLSELEHHTRERPRRTPRAEPDRRAADNVGNPLPVALLWIGLTIASLATWALFQLLLPLLLTLLSLVFGSSLRRAAATCRDVGRRGRAGIRRAKRTIAERADRAAALRHQARVRVETAVPRPRTRIATEPIEDELVSEPEPDLRHDRHHG